MRHAIEHNTHQAVQAAHFGIQEKSDMAFVNEFSTLEDREKYGVAELQRTGRVPGWDAWTIDRERNIILMLIGQGSREGPDSTKRFLLLRTGKIDYLTLIQEYDQAARSIHWAVPRRGPAQYQSPEEQAEFEARHQILKEALRVYKAAGCYESPRNEYENIVFDNF